MKNVIIYAASAALLLNSCGTYTGEGAYAGATLGSVIGSAIGGISDGRRGHDMGTLIGMAGGAIVGGAVGAMADQQDRRERHEHYERIQQQKAQQQQQIQRRQPVLEQDVIIDETNSSDDRIEDFTLNASPEEETISVKDLVPKVEIRHAQFVDESGDNSLSRNETGKLTFEVYNMGEAPLYGLEPIVIESTGNKYIHVSPSIIVEKIRPRRGIRYTATIKADNRAKDGTACLQAMVRLNGQSVAQPVAFNISTKKK